MALRTFQFCIVFTIGICWGPAIVSAVATIGKEISLSLSLQDPQDVTVARGQPATLRCNASSAEPGLQVSWLHENVIIAPNDSRRQAREDGTLYIRKVANKRLVNEGEYRCLVRNKIGALLSNPATLRIATWDKDFLAQPEDTTVLEGQPVVLACSVQSTPAARIIWKRNNLPLPHSTRYVPLPSGALLITQCTHSLDSGSYKCLATNDIAKKSRHSESATLTVLQTTNSDPQVPEFLHLGDTNVTGLVGSNLSLFCAAKGFPAPKIQWVNSSDSTVVGNLTELRLQNISAETAGEYHCIASNSERRILQKYTVNVQQPPYFIKKPTSKTYPSAKTVRLECEVGGLPHPKVYWLKDGVLLISDNWRIKEQPTGLVLSHSFTTDAGIYQCVAVNPAGMVWAAALVLPNLSETRPSPPTNVRCRSYDESSVCLQWQAPTNVTIQAYNVYSYHSDPVSEKKKVRGSEYLTNVTYKLADGLKPSMNYSFYVRVYSTEASDQSMTVTCETVTKGERDLQFRSATLTTLNISWSEMSSDIPCGGNATYKVQWRRKKNPSVSVEMVQSRNYTITGLTPSSTYEIRVQSVDHTDKDTPWTPFTMSNVTSFGDVDKLKTKNYSAFLNKTSSSLAAPERLDAEPASSSSINLTWFVSRDIESVDGYFAICYKEVKSVKSCEEDSSNLLKSSSNRIEISGLKPYTLYEFKVQIHTANGLVSQFSHSVECRTLEDVPMPVQDVNWKIENVTTVCLRWRTPAETNGPLKQYVISYTSDQNRPLEQWISLTVPATQNISNNCWVSGSDSVSTRLYSLKAGAKYTLVVRAGTEAGLGNPTIPITLFTRGHPNLGTTETILPPNNRDDVHENQQLGIFIGVTVALFCIVACVSCMLVRRRCIKNQALVEARTSAGNVPNGPLTITPNANVIQLRMLQDTCTAEAHEMQCLMQSDITTPHIPPLRNVHLDTKGGVGYPNTNGQLNGLKHSIYTNGHVGNGQVHITENPRYDATECNGNSNRPHKDSKHLQCCPTDDLNCTKSSNSPNQSLNCTQLTNLEDSLPVVPPSPRRISPALGPNG